MPGESSTGGEQKSSPWKITGRHVAVALGVFGAGFVSFSVSQPVAPWPVIWLPSGIALAVWLAWGMRGVAAVAIGVAGGYWWDLSNAEWQRDPGGLVLAVAGGTLATVLGPWVAKCVVCLDQRWRERLMTERGALRFYLITSVAAGAVSAAILLVFWMPAGLVEKSSAVFFLGVQFCGHALGAALLGTMLFFWRQGSELKDENFLFRIFMPFLAALLASLLMLAYVNNSAVAGARAYFSDQVAERVGRIERMLTGHLQVVQSVRSLWDSSRQVEQSEFQTFVERALEHGWGLKALAWVPEVPAEDAERLEVFMKSVPVSGGANLFLQDSGSAGNPQGEKQQRNRNRYLYPLLFVEPLGLLKDVEGIDSRAREAVHSAIEKGRGLRVPVASGVFNLAGRDTVALVGWIGRGQQASESGVSPQAWADGLSGFALGFIDVEEVLVIAASGEKAASFDLALYDRGFEGRDGFEPFDGKSNPVSRREGTRNSTQASVLIDERVVPFAGRAFEIQAISHEPVTSGNRLWSIFTAQGALLLMVDLLGILVLSAAGRTVRVEKEVRERTAELAEARARAEEIGTILSHFFEMSLDLWCVAGMDGYFKKVNSAFSTNLGYSEEELLARPFLDFVHPDDREKTLEAVAELTEGRKVIRFQNRYRTRSGRYVWLEWASAPETRRELIHATARNVTRQRQMEDELRRSNAELEQFAYVASHDLQEPLRMVTSFAQLLERRYEGKLGDDADEYIRHLIEGSERMRKLIRGLLEVSQVQRKASNMEVVNAGRALQSAIENLSVAIEEAGTRIEYEELPDVCVDRDQLVRLFQNLLSNAIKYGDSNDPRVTISADQSDGEWIFAVEDNGAGIRPEHRDRIFQLFQRLESDTGVSGTGIGLAICQKIVSRHGGKIWVEDSSSGGAVFRFSLPTVGNAE